MAKVEEAREIPSVKVLDEGDVPETKSFPPRMLLVGLGVFLFVAGGCLWTLLNARWQEIEPQHPGKLLAQEISHTMLAKGTKIANTVSQYVWRREDASNNGRKVPAAPKPVTSADSE